jgi:GntR family transcriptional regulator
MSYTEQMSSRGLPPSSKVVVSKLIDGEQEITGRLGLVANSKLVKIERVRHTGDEPFALETCYLPADTFSNLIAAPLARTSLFATLEHDYDVQLAYADEEVDATVAEGRVAQLLNIRSGAPLLRIRQVIYSAATKPVIYVIGFYRSERHSLFVRRLR